MVRVLSLLSATTEIVCRLGCSHMLVGRSHGCDDPPFVMSLPVVTEPRVDPKAPSRELDEAVRLYAVSGGAIYQINNDLVASLRPDVIITQVQCRICAVTPNDIAGAFAAFASHSTAKLITIKPMTMEDVMNDILTIAVALDVPERGNQLVDMMKSRLKGLSDVTEKICSKPRVVHLEWLDPIMGSGYWIAQCAAFAGCRMVHGTHGGHSPTIPLISSLADADVIILAPCGFSLMRTFRETAKLPLLSSPEWAALPAVRAGAVFVADGNLFFNRSSCRILETAEIIAEAAHPELCGLFGHHGRVFVRLDELDGLRREEKSTAATSSDDVPHRLRTLQSDGVAEKETSPIPWGTMPWGITQKHFIRQMNGRKPTKKNKQHRAQSNFDLTLNTMLEAIPDAIGRGMGGEPARGGNPGAASTPDLHVQVQVAFMREGDFASAFKMNSAANRARLGDVDTFRSMVLSQPAFAALAAHKHELLRYGEKKTGGSEGAGRKEGKHSVEYCISGGKDDEQPYTFLFDVRLGKDTRTYETESVRVVC